MKGREYKAFFRQLSRSLAGAAPKRAPSGIADRILARILDGDVPGPEWSWRPGLALAGAAACFVLLFGSRPERPTSPPPAAPEARILSFTADQAVVDPNQSITLRWEVAHAKSVEIRHPSVAHVELTGKNTARVRVSRPGQYTFVLIAKGADGRSVSQAAR